MPITFKPYLQQKIVYIGGKSKDEIQIEGKEIYKLSSNENQLGSSPKAIAAIKKHLDNLSEYPDSSDKRFRLALEKFYKGKLTANQFITTNSGVANIEIILNAFLEEGTECIYSSPAFSAYKGFIPKTGAQGVDVPLIGDNFHLDVQGILSAINERTRLIFVTSPNNPTGTYLPKNQIDALVEALPDHVILVYDEVYYQYADAPDYVRALPYVRAGKNVIGVNSFSKAYGLAGLRIGYSYSTPQIAEYVQQLRRPFMINSLSMAAAIAALDDDEFIRQSTEMIHREKHFLYKELDKLGVKYWKTQANFILIKTDMPTNEFEELMLQEGVMVRLADSFGAPGCVRVTIGQRAANEAFLRGMRMEQSAISS